MHSIAAGRRDRDRDERDQQRHTGSGAITTTVTEPSRGLGAKRPQLLLLLVATYAHLSAEHRPPRRILSGRRRRVPRRRLRPPPQAPPPLQALHDRQLDRVQRLHAHDAGRPHGLEPHPMALRRRLLRPRPHLHLVAAQDEALIRHPPLDFPPPHPVGRHQFRTAGDEGLPPSKALPAGVSAVNSFDFCSVPFIDRKISFLSTMRK